MASLMMQIEVMAWHIGTFADNFDEWMELTEWCAKTEGMACMMSVQSGSVTPDHPDAVRFQVEGVNTATVYPTTDSVVVYNGFAFEVLSPDEYAAKYGSASRS